MAALDYASIPAEPVGCHLQVRGRTAERSRCPGRVRGMEAAKKSGPEGRRVKGVK